MKASKSYGELLNDPMWQRKRLEVLNAARWMCSQCGDNTRQLEVHHLDYIAGLKPWEYPDWILMVVCDTCHGLKHQPDPLTPDQLFMLRMMKQTTAGECATCGVPVTNPQGYGQTGRKLYCEECTNGMEPRR